MGPCLQPELLACKQSFQRQHPSPVPPLFSLPLAPKQPLKPFANCLQLLWAQTQGFAGSCSRSPRAEGCWGARAPLGWRRSAHTEQKYTRRLKTILILRSKRVAGRTERRIQRCVPLLFNELQQLQELSSRRTLRPERLQRCRGAVQGSRKRCTARASGCSKACRAAADPAEETEAAALIQATFERRCGCESSKLP